MIEPMLSAAVVAVAAAAAADDDVEIFVEKGFDLGVVGCLL